MPRGQIDIDFFLTESGDYLVKADLPALGLRWSWLLRELNRLSDDDILDLFTEDREVPGPEGRWGLLDLQPYLLICQLQIPPAPYWEAGLQRGQLKVVRLFRRSGNEAAIAEMRRLEEEAERRWNEAGQSPD